MTEFEKKLQKALKQTKPKGVEIKVAETESLKTKSGSGK